MIYRYKNSLFNVLLGVVALCVTIGYLRHNQRKIISVTSAEFQHSPPIQQETIPKKLKGVQLPFHYVFESRKSSLSGYNYTTGTRNKDGQPKVILLGTPWNGVWTTINYYVLEENDTSFKHYNCPNTNCLVTRDQKRIKEADAVIFHLLDLPKRFPRYRHLNQLWIAYILEAPWLTKSNLTALSGVFNWTMSYREDSDVPVKYGFVGKKFPNDSMNVSATNKTPFGEKKSVVWFVSDCETPGNREQYVRELRKYIDVDVYGKCGTKKCFPAQSSLCYEEVLKMYKFYLSFENSLCTDYVTEKFFNVLEYDVVPVVYGDADYRNHGPPGGYVDATKFKDPEELAAYLTEIASNEMKYSKYLEWKSSYRSYLYPWMCYLCDKLHAPIVPSVKNDLKKWWVDDAKCRTWQKDKGFVIDQDPLTF